MIDTERELLKRSEGDKAARSLSQDRVREALTKFCVEHGVSYDLLKEVPIITEALRDSRQNQEEIEKAAAKAKMAENELLSQLDEARGRQREAEDRARTLQGQVQTLVHTISIITQPPPPPTDEDINRALRHTMLARL